MFENLPKQLLKKLEEYNKTFDSRIENTKNILLSKEQEIIGIIQQKAKANLKPESAKEFEDVSNLFAEPPIIVNVEKASWEIKVNYVSDTAKRMMGMYNAGSGSVGIPATWWLKNLLREIKK